MALCLVLGHYRTYFNIKVELDSLLKTNEDLEFVLILIFFLFYLSTLQL